MADLTIRAARTSDYPDFARLFPELLVGDPVPGLDRWRDEMVPSSLIAERDGQVVGYSYFQLIGTTGHIRNVVVAPQARGGGVGLALMTAMRRRFAEAGISTWNLNVKPDNQPARRLYERCGMQAQYSSTALGLRWELLAAVPGSPEAVVTQVVPPAEDGQFERALNLLPGELQGGRALPGRVVIGVRRAADSTPVGAAVFNPAFPGAYPFRVAQPVYCAALLGGMRAHALPQHDWVGMFIENDTAAVAALVAAGATVRLEALHYQGAVGLGAAH
jgi:ribosomal protein S18 acetylase RimI-like enzyme